MRLLVALALISCFCYAAAIFGGHPGGPFRGSRPRSLEHEVETYHVGEDSQENWPELDVTVGSSAVVINEPGAGGSESGGLTTVIDYERSITGVYDASAQRCYIAGGVPKTVPTPGLVKQALDEQGGPLEFFGPKLFYSVANDYPVKDSSLLPAQLQESCAGLPLHWVEPEAEEAITRRSIDEPAVGTRCCCGAVCRCCFSVRPKAIESLAPKPNCWRGGCFG